MEKEKKINLEKILTDTCQYHNHHGEPILTMEDVKRSMIVFGKELLSLASDNAEIGEFYKLKLFHIRESFCPEEDTIYNIHKQSIIDTIDQVDESTPIKVKRIKEEKTCHSEEDGISHNMCVMQKSCNKCKSYR